MKGFFHISDPADAARTLASSVETLQFPAAVSMVKRGSVGGDGGHFAHIHASLPLIHSFICSERERR